MTPPLPGQDEGDVSATTHVAVSVVEYHAGALAVADVLAASDVGSWRYTTTVGTRRLDVVVMGPQATKPSGTHRNRQERGAPPGRPAEAIARVVTVPPWR